MKSAVNYLYFLFVCGTVDGFSQLREVEIFSQTDLVETAPPTEVVFIGFQENNHHNPGLLYNFLEPSFLDEDGFANELEVAIGSDPLDSSDVGVFQAGFEEVEGNMVYQFLEPISSLLPSPVLETSSDLSAWSNSEAMTVTVATNQADVPAGYRRMEYVLPENDDKKFIRIGFQ